MFSKLKEMFLQPFEKYWGDFRADCMTEWFCVFIKGVNCLGEFYTNRRKIAYKGNMILLYFESYIPYSL